MCDNGAKMTQTRRSVFSLTFLINCASKFILNKNFEIAAFKLKQFENDFKLKRRQHEIKIEQTKNSVSLGELCAFSIQYS